MVHTQKWHHLVHVQTQGGRGKGLYSSQSLGSPGFWRDCPLAHRYKDKIFSFAQKGERVLGHLAPAWNILDQKWHTSLHSQPTVRTCHKRPTVEEIREMSPSHEPEDESEWIWRNSRTVSHNTHSSVMPSFRHRSLQSRVQKHVEGKTGDTFHHLQLDKNGLSHSQGRKRTQDWENKPALLPNLSYQWPALQYISQVNEVKQIPPKEVQRAARKEHAKWTHRGPKPNDQGGFVGRPRVVLSLRNEVIYF